jgi:transcriptional regulator with XRE-family HTH domain
MSSEYEIIFRQRLREIIKQKGFEQKEIAEKMGLSIQTVNTWFREANPSAPVFPRLCELADLIGVSLDYLAGRTDEPKVRRARKPTDK